MVPQFGPYKSQRLFHPRYILLIGFVTVAVTEQQDGVGMFFPYRFILPEFRTHGRHIGTDNGGILVLLLFYDLFLRFLHQQVGEQVGGEAGLILGDIPRYPHPLPLLPAHFARLHPIYAVDDGHAQYFVILVLEHVHALDAQRINTFNYGGLEHYLYSEIEEGLQELETQGVEYTIAYLHWGTEYETTENERQQNIAKELCELGIDALIGGHPHVVQPVDLLTNEAGTHQMVCVYSLGNHLSDQRKERIDFAPEGHTEDGLMVELILEKSDDGQVSLTGMEFIPTWVYKSGSSDNPNYYILPLNDMETLLKETADLGIETEAKQSLARTNAIIGEGAAKIEAALPIAAK